MAMAMDQEEKKKWQRGQSLESVETRRERERH